MAEQLQKNCYFSMNSRFEKLSGLSTHSKSNCDNRQYGTVTIQPTAQDPRKRDAEDVGDTPEQVDMFWSTASPRQSLHHG
mmetsp:Transcript_19400/g.36227  ORF Transcript_19400/g.36227 Transcript_19400/m.36227 type:complete len:80 (-) Transcript_19400:487-726(-)